MANATVAQSVNRRSAALALREARVQAAHHQAWLNAINKAALYLAGDEWQFDGETLIISSATTNGARYHVTSHSCECKAFAAGRPCWHRASVRLLEKAGEAAALPKAMSVEEFDELTERMNGDLF
jgi:hypothetical protein